MRRSSTAIFVCGPHYPSPCVIDICQNSCARTTFADVILFSAVIAAAPAARVVQGCNSGAPPKRTRWPQWLATATVVVATATGGRGIENVRNDVLFCSAVHHIREILAFQILNKQGIRIQMTVSKCSRSQWIETSRTRRILMAAAVLPPHGRYPRNSLLPEYTIGSESCNINQKRVTHDIPRIL